MAHRESVRGAVYPVKTCGAKLTVEVEFGFP